MRLAFAWVLLLTGCGATVGPYVTDIQEEPDGRFKVTSCTTEVSGSGNNTIRAELGECTTKIIGQPREPNHCP